MIPRHLKITGFLSYRDPVEIDFDRFDLACISGRNGAGKSSLLDGMTWALFGQARNRDESVINLQSKTAEVVFTFGYEGNLYRVIRTLTRGKSTVLEFQVHNPAGSAVASPDEGQWRPLTEHGLRETQARIEQTLRLDYDTFINVSFFLQGRADQFAQQKPGRRKEILGSILGLEVWETYKERAAGHRKDLESELKKLEGHVAEIEAELSEEGTRKQRLLDLETQLKELGSLRKAQETARETSRQLQTGLERQRQQVKTLSRDLERSQADLEGSKSRLAGREQERIKSSGVVARAAEIEAAHADWLRLRQELDKWDGLAVQFHEMENRRRPFLDEITTEKARLEQERSLLQQQKEDVTAQAITISGFQDELSTARKKLAKAEVRLRERPELETRLQADRGQQAELLAANASLKKEMDLLDQRIKKLQAAEGADCPLCGQPLSPQHRKATLEQLQAEGSQKGDAWRSNKASIDGLVTNITRLEAQLAELSKEDTARLTLSTQVAQLDERLQSLTRQAAEWEMGGAKRLEEVVKNLEGETYSKSASKQLAKVDKELQALGYDDPAHQVARAAEQQARSAGEEYRRLETARAELKPLEDEIASLQERITTLAAEIAARLTEHGSAQQALEQMEAQAPEPARLERELNETKERENLLNQDVGAARQKVNVLDELRRRRKDLETRREELGQQIGRFQRLERAFGRDGVPALLIEQALPEIEMKANEILERLSDGAMYINFETQSRYKDDKRADLRETLEIRVSDGAGPRDYEMYSGGEAFRVNFAIRLALSEVLARRKGARLQMLVIDEGFGSQDSLGRQRLIQAINTVRGDFAKILVITHLDELKDAFPNRIEVEKTESGSTIEIF